jgi:hypothetical protein
MKSNDPPRFLVPSLVSFAVCVLLVILAVALWGFDAVWP